VEKDLIMSATGKQKGLILAFTGAGKGKTTAALGTALRMIARGGRVGMVRFLKSGAMESQALGKFGPKFRAWNFGGGFTWQVSLEENVKAVQEAWKRCRMLLRDPKYDLVIFDEIHIALKYKFLKTTDVLKALKEKISSQHVVLTGRGAPKSILKVADLVTEMKCLKHPFQKGIPAQPGITFNPSHIGDSHFLLKNDCPRFCFCPRNLLSSSSVLFSVR